jgi:hypothetical protein
MTPLLAAEYYKLRRRPACWLTILIGASVIAFFYLLLATIMFTGIDTESGAESLENLRDFTALRNSSFIGYGITQFVVSTLGIIMMAIVITSEFSWRTVLTTVNWTGERGKLLAARMIVVALFLAVAIALGWIVTAIGSTLIELADGTLSSEGLDAGFVASILASGARTWLTVITYALLAATISSVSRSLAAGIGLALVIRFLEPVGIQIFDALPGGIAALTHLAISPNVDALLQANGVLDPESTPDRDLPGTLQATVYLIGFCLISGALSIFTFVRQDIDV